MTYSSRKPTTTANRVSPWLWLLAAGATEAVWLGGLKYAATPLAWLATAFAIFASIALAVKAARAMAATTVYILFTGAGTVGAFVVDDIAGGRTPPPAAIFWLVVLLIGLFGLVHSGP